MIHQNAARAPAERGWFADFLAFLGLVVLVAGGAVFLARTAGPPHLPARIPSGAEILDALGATTVPYDAIAYVLSALAWLLLAYLALAVVLRVVADIVAALLGEHRLARRLLAVSNRVTLPLVRRIVDGVLVVVTVAYLLGPDLGPAPAMAAPVTQMMPTDRHRNPPLRGSVERAMDTTSAADTPTFGYVVKRGDTLRGLARRFLGDEMRWPAIWELNRGQAMRQGQRFDNPDLILPGWKLQIPDDGGQAAHRVYVVKPGDALWNIASRELGDGTRWRAIWQLNEGRVMNDGEVFSEPRLIQPGWQLYLPGAPDQRSPSPAPSNAAPPAAPPVASPPGVQPAPRQAPTPASTVAPTPSPSTTVEPTPLVSITVPPLPTPPILTLPDETTIAATFGAALLGLLAFVALHDRVRRRETDATDEPTGFRPGPFLSALRQRFASQLETDKVALVANRLWMLLGAWGEQSAELISCREGRTSLTFALRCDPDQADRFADYVPDLAAELRVKARVERVGARDILLHLSGLSYRAMLESIRPDFYHDFPLLCPLGTDPDEQVFHLNLALTAPLLVAGASAESAADLLQTLLVVLAAQAHPRQLRLALVGDPRGRLAGLADLPHLVGSVTDQDSAVAVTQALEQCQAELSRRIGLFQRQEVASIASYNAFRENGADLLPYWVIAIDGVGAILEHPDVSGLLATLCQDGPRYGLILLGATAAAASLAEPILDAFPARLSLRLPDEAQSVRILGEPGAEDLAADDEMILKVRDGALQKLRQLRIGPDELAECVGLMVAALGDPLVDREDSDGEPGEMDEISEVDTTDQPAPRREEVGEIAGGAPVAAEEIAPRHELRPRGDGPSMELMRDVIVADPGSPEFPSEDDARRRGMIRVYCLGRFRVFVGMTEITGHNGRLAKATRERPLFTAKPRELLAYFITYPDTDVAREKVLEVLWPDADTQTTNHTLYNALWAVRSRINGLDADGAQHDYISFQSGGYRIEKDLFWVDAWEFDACVQQAEAVEASDPVGAARLRERAIELYQGDYLDQTYYEWAEPERQRLRQVYLQTLRALVDYHAKGGHPERAIAHLVTAIEQESFDESLHRKLLTLYARVGDWPALVHHYESLEALLERDLGTKPDGKTQDLYHRLLARRDGEPKRADIPV